MIMQRLSLLARGTLDESSSNNDCAGFIPAGAGNTRILAALAPDEAVYPRWRGEHTTLSDSLDKYRGLSPLARGTLAQVLKCDVEWRFIPAGAGNTASRSKYSPSASVYPRWRGEHQKRGFQRAKTGGLSPLARGTQVALRSSLMKVRFIPAGAGNTASFSRWS